MNARARFPLALALAIAAYLSTGCAPATFLAAESPPSVDTTEISAGMTFDQVERVLGAKLFPLEGADGVYLVAFMDVEAWEHRKWAYYAFDLPTATAASLILAPIEMAIRYESERHAVAHFVDGRLVMFRESEDGRHAVGYIDGMPEFDHWRDHKYIAAKLIPGGN